MRTKDIENIVERVWAQHSYSFETKECSCGAKMSFTDHELHVAVAVFKEGRTRVARQ